MNKKPAGWFGFRSKQFDARNGRFREAVTLLGS